VKRWLKILNGAALVASLGLVAVYLWRNAEMLRGIEWRGLVCPIALSLLLYAMSLGAQAYIWISTVSGMIGVRWSAWDLVVYLETHLMRRLPGAPWYVASRAAIYSDYGPDGVAAALTVSALEWLGILATSGIWIIGGYWGWLPGFGVAVLVFTMAALIPRLGRSKRCPRWLSGLAVLPRSRILVALSAYVFVWPLAAVILWLILSEIAPEANIGAARLVATWASSAVMSMLMVFSPSGFGIRELALIAQLRHAIGLGRGALVALLLRLVFILGDVTYLGLTVALRSLWRKRVIGGK